MTAESANWENLSNIVGVEATIKCVRDHWLWILYVESIWSVLLDT